MAYGCSCWQLFSNMAPSASNMPDWFGVSVSWLVSSHPPCPHFLNAETWIQNWKWAQCFSYSHVRFCSAMIFIIRKVFGRWLFFPVLNFERLGRGHSWSCRPDRGVKKCRGWLGAWACLIGINPLKLLTHCQVWMPLLWCHRSHPYRYLLIFDSSKVWSISFDTCSPRNSQSSLGFIDQGLVLCFSAGVRIAGHHHCRDNPQRAPWQHFCTVEDNV